MHSRQRAFSLIELLVVVAIIGIISTFAIPAMQGLLKGSALTQASSQLTDQMSLARQHSISRNRAVEVRFYRFGDPEQPGELKDDPETGHFRAFQYFEVSDQSVILPVGKVQMVPDTMIMSDHKNLSNILDDTGTTSVWTEGRRYVPKAKLDMKIDPELPRGVGHNYDYVAFRFLPDGSTTLLPLGKKGQPSEGGKWFITIHALGDINKTEDGSKPPPNFFTWMVDPVTGSSKSLRPGISTAKPTKG